VDYLGESRRWPIVAAGSGLLDRTGTPKPMALQRQSWWSDKPVVHMVRRIAPAQSTSADPGFTPLDRRQVLFADWSPTEVRPEGEEIEVFSNCEDVELQLNGKSLGAKKRSDDASPRTWVVVFKPGTLRAIGRDHGKVVVREELHTVGKPEKILLKADREKLAQSWDDVSYVSATVVDKNDVPIPGADDLITFKVSGPGVVAAVDSADNSSHDSFQASERHAYQGTCFAILKSTASSGKIHLTATAKGLSEASVTLKAVEAGE
jgi:beta-galactosidase